MAEQQTNELIAWLEENYPKAVLSIDEVKAFIVIERTPEPDVIGRWAEKVPQRVIDEMIQEEKDSGEYYQLDNKVEAFKKSITEKYEM